MTVDPTMSVLVVDDSRTTGPVVRNLLMLIGFRDVDHVFDGITALIRLHERSLWPCGFGLEHAAHERADAFAAGPCETRCYKAYRSSW
jgi:hypothetical protein